MGLGSTNPTTSDSLREIATATNAGETTPNKVLKPKDLSKDMYIENNIYHDGYLKLLPLGTKATYRMNEIHITDYGVSIGEMANRTAGLGVHGPITVGKYMLSEQEQNALKPGGGCTPTRNTISIYASGAGADEHFEILGSPRILLGVKGGGYVFVDTGNKVGINTTGFNASSTLTVNGPIKIGNDCVHKTCTEANKGEIRYYETSTNGGYFVGCTKTSNGYAWRSLTMGNSDITIPSNNCNGLVIPPYNQNDYTYTTLAPEQVCR